MGPWGCEPCGTAPPVPQGLEKVARRGRWVGGSGWGGGREWELGTGKRMREMTQTLETLLYIVVFGPKSQRICGFAGSDIKISNPLADIRWV